MEHVQLTDCINIFPKYDWSSVINQLTNTWKNLDIQSVTLSKIFGGFSPDELFHLTLNDKDYVLRMFNPEREATFCRQFIQISNWASDNKFGPEIYLADEQSRFLIMEKLEGSHLRLNDFDSDSLLIEMGHALSKIHAATPPDDIGSNSLFTEGIRWYQSIGHKSQKMPAVMNEAYQMWLSLHDKVDCPDVIQTMQHGDFSQKNMFMKEGSIVLVDWEFACYADPRREIARVCLWFGLEGDRRHIFLSSYYGREPSEQELYEIAILECMINLGLCWRIFSIRIFASLSKSAWDELYEKTEPLSLRDFALDHTRPDQKEITTAKIQSYAVGHLKYFLQMSKDLSL